MRSWVAELPGKVLSTRLGWLLVNPGARLRLWLYGAAGDPESDLIGLRGYELYKGLAMGDATVHPAIRWVTTELFPYDRRDEEQVEILGEDGVSRQFVESIVFPE